MDTEPTDPVAPPPTREKRDWSGILATWFFGILIVWFILGMIFSPPEADPGPGPYDCDIDCMPAHGTGGR